MKIYYRLYFIHSLISLARVSSEMIIFCNAFFAQGDSPLYNNTNTNNNNNNNNNNNFIDFIFDKKISVPKQ